MMIDSWAVLVGGYSTSHPLSSRYFASDPVVLSIPLRFAVLVHALPKNCIVML